MTVVYVLKCPRTNQVRYVGEGGETRPFDHVRKVRKGQQTSNPRLTSWIAKLLQQGLEPLIEVVATGLSKAQALDEEHSLIVKYGRKGFEKNGILLNISERGTEYDRSGMNNPFYGKKHREETLVKMAEAKRGKKRGEQFSETMREVAAKRPPRSVESLEKQAASMRAFHANKVFVARREGQHITARSAAEMAHKLDIKQWAIYKSLREQALLDGWHLSVTRDLQHP